MHAHIGKMEQQENNGGEPLTLDVQGKLISEYKAKFLVVYQYTIEGDQNMVVPPIRTGNTFRECTVPLQADLPSMPTAVDIRGWEDDLAKTPIGGFERLGVLVTSFQQVRYD